MKQELCGTPPILYFGNDWHAENRTSSHQIARQLAKHCDVLYVECPGLRAPRGSGRDLSKIWQKLLKFAQGSRQVQPGLRVATLLQIPLHRFALVRWLNARVLRLTMRWLVWRSGFRNPISWFMVPHLASLAGRLHEALSVYYCIDDYAALPGVDPVAVQAMDETLTRRADLVFVASETLLAPKKALNKNTYVSPHGVDFDHFVRAQDEDVEAPADVADLPHPVIGFFGLIESWIDLELVDYLAEQRPDWSFVLIGQVAVPAEQVPSRPNVHVLGKRSYDDLPAYASQFDAAIIPYRLTRQVMNANPIKLREYLATGKPVVSVSTPEIEKYADVVSIAHNREEFLSKLDEAVQTGLEPHEIQRRQERVALMSWDTRVNEVVHIVSSYLREKVSVRQAAFDLVTGDP